MSARKELLLLVHRIPYPPNKGDKIRSFNLLKHLARTYRVHVGAFVDDLHDWRYKNDLKALCSSGQGEICLLKLKPVVRKLLSMKAFISGDSLTVPYYAHSTMQNWVDDLLARRPIGQVVVFSSPMAQFVSGAAYSHLRRVADFVDVDSDKWAQYACAKPWPQSWVYAREARTLFAFERKIADEFDATVFVTDEKCAMFKKMAPEVATRVSTIDNGVDADYFSPEREYPNPYPYSCPRLIFTGAMDYWANVDAVSWFVKEIFPAVRAAVSDAEFYIVGGRPTDDVMSLGSIPGITVTGAVDDIRPYLAHAQAAVAPMRIARGVQNKVLEAMAMAKPVLATPEAAEGVRAQNGNDLLVEAGLNNFQKQAICLLLAEGMNLGAAARCSMIKHYSWEKNLQQFNQLLEVDNSLRGKSHNQPGLVTVAP